MMKKPPEPIGKCARYECKHHDKPQDARPCNACVCNVLRKHRYGSFYFCDDAKEREKNDDDT